MWLIDVPDYAGKKPRKLLPHDPPDRISTGHEFACADGWIGTQYREFHGGYRKNPVEYFAFVDPVTNKLELFKLDGQRPGHFQGTRDRKRAIADGHSRAGVIEPKSVDEIGNVPEYQTMARYELRDGRAIATAIAKHDSSFRTHESHPHPVFTPDEQHVLWASDRGGHTHLYMCRFDG
jgi:oligogalacturonide lyase